MEKKITLKDLGVLLGAAGTSVEDIVAKAKERASSVESSSSKKIDEINDTISGLYDSLRVQQNQLSVARATLKIANSVAK